MLIRTGTPLDGTYQTRPNALDEFRLWQRLFFLLRLDRRNHLVRKTKLVVNPKKIALEIISAHIRVRITVFQVFFYGSDDFLLENGVLLLGPPVRDLSQPLFSEKLVKDLILSLVQREEEQEVFDPTLLESAREVVDRVFSDVRTEDDGDNVSCYIWITRQKISFGVKPVGNDDAPFLIRWSLVKLWRQPAVARP